MPIERENDVLDEIDDMIKRLQACIQVVLPDLKSRLSESSTLKKPIPRYRSEDIWWDIPDFIYKESYFDETDIECTEIISHIEAAKIYYDKGFETYKGIITEFNELITSVTFFLPATERQTPKPEDPKMKTYLSPFPAQTSSSVFEGVVRETIEAMREFYFALSVYKIQSNKHEYNVVISKNCRNRRFNPLRLRWAKYLKVAMNILVKDDTSRQERLEALRDICVNLEYAASFRPRPYGGKQTSSSYIYLTWRGGVKSWQNFQAWEVFMSSLKTTLLSLMILQRYPNLLISLRSQGRELQCKNFLQECNKHELSEEGTSALLQYAGSEKSIWLDQFFKKVQPDRTTDNRDVARLIMDKLEI